MTYFRALLAVLQELFLFVIRPSTQSVSSRLVLPSVRHSQTEPLVTAPVLPVTAAASLQLKSDGSTTESSLPVLLHTYTEGYVCVSETKVYARPVEAFDSVLLKLPYATLVVLMRHEGRFTQVRYKDMSGWVVKDELVSNKELIYPPFVSGTVYDAYHDTTILVRRLLNDAFAATTLFLPLQAVEYASYVLLLQGRTIAWSDERPRPAGQWHALLRGRPEIHSSVTPRTGALMEYVTTTGIGYIAYTESVRPDGTIVVAGVGKATEGQFMREEVAPETYVEWRPVWITVG